MSEKKHIDRIFQEKLKDFDVTPNANVWKNIQKELQASEDNPKGAIPIWWRYVGIAALLLLFITIGRFVFDESDADLFPNHQTVEENSKNPSNLENSSNGTYNPSEQIVDSKTDLETTNVVPSTNNESVPSISSNSEDTNSVEMAKNAFKSAEKTTIAKTQNKNDINTKNATSQSSSNYKIANNNPSKSDLNLPNNVNSEKLSNAVVDHSNFKNDTQNTTNKNPNKTVSSNPNVNSSVVQSSSNTEFDEMDANKLIGEDNTKEAVALNAMKGDNPHNEKEKEDSQKVGDSLISESPTIEEAIAQAEEINEKEEEKLVDRWQVYANVAPVYYNSLGKGSHIDEQFVSNSKSGETNTSYGVNVSYALNKKLSVRSGVNTLRLSYDTDNVILYETAGGGANPNPVNPLRNIQLAPASQSLNAFSADNLGFQQINDVLYNAAISQRLSYYEVPVELEYKLVNNRFGLNIIGGVSTFFLDENKVYSEFEEYTTFIGEANNINNVSFSTNIGIGLNYKFTEKFKFNLEPTFKYQLNAYENTSGNFRPYIIGVYTGFSYKF